MHLLMYNSQQTKNQTFSGFSPQVNPRSTTLGTSQNITMERASEDFPAAALRDILTSFRTEITNVLPSLSQEPLSKDRIERRLGLLESQIDGLLRRRTFKTVATKEGAR